MNRLQKYKKYQKEYYRKNRDKLLANRKKRWAEFRQWQVANSGLSDPRD